MTLMVNALRAGYGRAPVLHDVSLDVADGEIVAVLGPNGAGKTTLLRSIVGVLPARGGRVLLDGNDISRYPAPKRARVGVAWSPEGRRLFPSLSVLENLLIGGRGLNEREQQSRLQEVVSLFPALASLLDRPAWKLSGGQQQMVAVGRALVSRPRILLLDEPSLGLAPIVVNALMEALRTIGQGGQAMLLVEQNAAAALALADRVVTLSRGRVTFSGPPNAVRTDELLGPHFQNEQV